MNKVDLCSVDFLINCAEELASYLKNIKSGCNKDYCFQFLYCTMLSRYIFLTCEKFYKEEENEKKKK